MIDLKGLIEKRIGAILSNDSSVYVEYEVTEGEGADRGVIIILDEHACVINYEFVESEISWMRPEAIDEYNEAADDEIPVSVIVPDEAFLAMSQRVKKYGNKDIAVFGYEDIRLRRKALPA